MRRLKRLASELMGRGHDHKVRAANASYDMAADPDELFYREQYLARILPELERAPSGRKARILDLGCGHGRLSLSLAEWARQGSVLGVDFSAPSVEAARRYAAERGLANARFEAADAAAFARGLAPASLDAAVSTEMLYNLPSYRETLAHLAKALVPGGLLFASFRSRWYDLLKAVRARDFESARLVLEKREGHWGGRSVWSAWHTPEDLKTLLPQAGFEAPRLYAIGALSGIAGDPLEAVARPGALTDAERESLLALELSAAEELAGQGRYILAVTRRKA